MVVRVISELCDRQFQHVLNRLAKLASPEMLYEPLDPFEVVEVAEHIGPQPHKLWEEHRMHICT